MTEAHSLSLLEHETIEHLFSKRISLCDVPPQIEKGPFCIQAVKSEMIERGNLTHIASGDAHKRHTTRLSPCFSVLRPSQIK